MFNTLKITIVKNIYDDIEKKLNGQVEDIKKCIYKSFPVNE